MAKNNDLPTYYEGQYRGIRAHHIIADYNLSYNIGTAVTYLLRAGKKPNNPIEQDIKKAIDHLNFELEKLNDKEKKAIDRINKKLFNGNTDSTY